MKAISFLRMIILIIVVMPFVGCSNDTSKAIYFKKDISEDATPAVLEKILQKQAKPISDIKFEKATYHFYPDKGLEKYCYISNHCDLMVKAAFPISNMNNVTIDGQGSTFIFHGVIIPFLIENSNHITVKNITIDWEVPFCSEGEIVANDLKEGTFDMQISDDYPYEIRNGQLFFIKEGYQHNLGQTILYNPKRKAIAYNTEAYTPLTDYNSIKASNGLDNRNYKYEIDFRSPENRTGIEKRLICEQLKPGLVRVHNHRKKLPQPGMILSTKGEQGFNRVSPAFRVTSTSNFKASNINIHHAGGMGIIAENSADITLSEFNITPSNGRMVSTTADATHFVGCRGKIVIKDCTFQNQLDDACNVHGTYQKVVDVLDDYRIGVRMGHHQQQGFVVGVPKDTLGFVRLDDSFFPYEKVTIKDIQYINGRYQIITLNEKLPKALQKGDLIENMNAYPELLIENCNISNNRARGLLLSTPRSTIIRNNFFSSEMEAILVPVESSHWFESGNATNLTITNNTFRNCNHSGYDRGIIRFVTDDDNQNIAFRHIEISGNKIEHFDNLILEVANTDGLIFKNNTISANNAFPQLFPDNPAITIKSSKNITFKDNTYNGKAKQIISTDNDMEAVVFN